MAIKIIDLNTETAPTDDDFIVIRDNLTGTTRKITRAVFFTDPPIPDGAIDGAMIANGAIQKRHLGEDAKIGIRTFTVASPGTLTPNVNDYDAFNITAASASIALAAPTGSPINKQGILISIKDNGTARSITWDGIYRPIGITLPNTTLTNRMIYVSGRYNTEAARWDMLSVARQA